MKKTIASVIAIFLSFAMFIPNLQVTFAEGNENGAVQSTEVSAEESMDVFGSETGPEISPDENGSASIQEGLPAEIQSGITEDSAASPEETGGDRKLLVLKQTRK